MRLIAFWAACVVLSASGLEAADLVSGTWTAGDGTAPRVYVLKASGDRLTGIVCGPCDDPASVFRIEDGRILDGDRATFFIRYDAGGPAFRRYGPYRERVDASLARNVMKLSARPEADSSAAPTSISLTRGSRSWSARSKRWLISSPGVSSSGSCAACAASRR